MKKSSLDLIEIPCKTPLLILLDYYEGVQGYTDQKAEVRLKAPAVIENVRKLMLTLQSHYPLPEELKGRHGIVD